MGVFSSQFSATIGDNQKIEVEARADLMGTGHYDLIINDEKVDSIKGTLGNFTMRGKVKKGDEEVPVKILVNQQLFGISVFVEYEGEKTQMDSV